VGLLYLVAGVTALVFPSGAWYSPGSPLWMDLIMSAALLSFTFVPIAVGLAVLRYRLYDIDLIINRALVYGPLTVLLAVTLTASGPNGSNRKPREPRSSSRATPLGPGPPAGSPSRGVRGRSARPRGSPAAFRRGCARGRRAGRG